MLEDSVTLKGKSPNWPATQFGSRLGRRHQPLHNDLQFFQRILVQKSEGRRRRSLKNTAFLRQVPLFRCSNGPYERGSTKNGYHGAGKLAVVYAEHRYWSLVYTAKISRRRSQDNLLSFDTPVIRVTENAYSLIHMTLLNWLYIDWIDCTLSAPWLKWL